MLGMINDPDLAPRRSRQRRRETPADGVVNSYRGQEVAGGVGIPAHFWYKFAIERGGVSSHKCRHAWHAISGTDLVDGPARGGRARGPWRGNRRESYAPFRRDVV
eukprot:2343467-Rhodomonas_salina.1